MFKEFNLFHLLAVIVVCLCVSCTSEIIMNGKERIAELNVSGDKK